MNINMRIAKQLIEIAKVLAADGSDYIYDPDHKKHPGGGYHKTESGWSKLKEKDVAPTSSVMTIEQKKLDKDAHGGIKKKLEVALSSKAHPITLNALANDNSDEVRAAVATNSNATPELLDKLSNDSCANVVQAVAKNSNTSSKTLDKLSYGHTYMKEAVAENPSTSPQTLERLSKEKSSSIDTIVGVSYNSNTPSKVLEKLGKHNSELVRRGVSRNSSTPSSALEKLSGDSDGGVRANVASNSNTPANVLDKLSTDENESVRCNVAKNKNTSYETLLHLGKYDNKQIREIVVNTLKGKIIGESHQSEKMQNTIGDWSFDEVSKFLNSVRTKLN